MSDENEETEAATAPETAETEQPNEAVSPVEGQTEQEAKTEATDETDAPSSEDAKPDKAEKERKRQSAQERINQAVAKQREAERAASRLQKKLDAIEAGNAPDPAKFEDLDELNAEQTKHAVQQMRRAEVEADATDAIEVAADARDEAWEAKVVTFKEDVPDFEEKVTMNANLRISQNMAEIIKEAENGPAVAYYLASNPTEAAQISRLSEREQALKIGRIEGKLSTPPTRKVTQAPEPVKTVKGKSPGTEPNIYSSKLSMKEYAAARMGQPDMQKEYGKG